MLTTTHMMTPHRLHMHLKIAIEQQLGHKLRLIVWAAGSHSGTSHVPTLLLYQSDADSQDPQTYLYQMGTEVFLVFIC